MTLQVVWNIVLWRHKSKLELFSSTNSRPTKDSFATYWWKLYCVVVVCFLGDKRLSAIAIQL